MVVNLPYFHMLKCRGSTHHVLYTNFQAFSRGNASYFAKSINFERFKPVMLAALRSLCLGAWTSGPWKIRLGLFLKGPVAALKMLYLVKLC